MAKVTITTDDGEVVRIIQDDELPTRLTTLSSVDLVNEVFDSVQCARATERAAQAGGQS